MSLIALIVALVAGAVLGAAHFFSLRWSVALIRDRRTALGVGLQALRFVVLAVALALIARRGAWPFLAAAAGILAARSALIWRARRLA